MKELGIEATWALSFICRPNPFLLARREAGGGAGNLCVDALGLQWDGIKFELRHRSGNHHNGKTRRELIQGQAEANGTPSGHMIVSKRRSRQSMM